MSVLTMNPDDYDLACGVAYDRGIRAGEIERDRLRAQVERLSMRPTTSTQLECEALRRERDRAIKEAQDITEAIATYVEVVHPACADDIRAGRWKP